MWAIRGKHKQSRQSSGQEAKSLILVSHMGRIRGASERDRTSDLLITNELLKCSQLLIIIIIGDYKRSDTRL